MTVLAVVKEMLDLLECTSLKYRQALRLLRVQPWPVGMLQLLYLVGEHLTDSRFKVQYLLCTSTHAQKIYRNYAIAGIGVSKFNDDQSLLVTLIIVLWAISETRDP